uniref:54/1 gene n=1 Tax=Schizosaccharomyces pombe TaxID=4896 RepID=Q09185_SCHPM|nr:unnamed protein product [Schizosaccharomyces pombe]
MQLYPANVKGLRYSECCILTANPSVQHFVVRGGAGVPLTYSVSTLHAELTDHLYLPTTKKTVAVGKKTLFVVQKKSFKPET